LVNSLTAEPAIWRKNGLGYRRGEAPAIN